MPNISAITLPNGTTYDIEDVTARSMASGGITFLGITTTALTDGATTTTITVGGKSVSVSNGNLAIYNNKEFVYATADNKWHEFGDTSGLGSLATKNSASGNYTPEGSVSKPSFTGTQGSVSVKGTPAGTISTGTGTANYTPAGSISIGTGTANYTPQGSVSTPTITVTPSTVSKYVAGSETGGGSVTQGTAASCTLPNLEIGVTGETLTLNWTAGSFTANTPTAVTLPSFSQQTIATGISSATASQPTFTGTGKELKFTGTGTQLKFTGSELTSTGNFTPSGDVSQPSFTGTQKAVTVS